MMVVSDIELEQFVYLKTDPEQYQRMVTAISVFPGNVLNYELSSGSEKSYHYRFEITTEKQFAQ